ELNGLYLPPGLTPEQLFGHVLEWNAQPDGLPPAVLLVDAAASLAALPGHRGARPTWVDGWAPRAALPGAGPPRPPAPAPAAPAPGSPACRATGPRSPASPPPPPWTVSGRPSNRPSGRAPGSGPSPPHRAPAVMNSRPPTSSSSSPTTCSTTTWPD